MVWSVLLTFKVFVYITELYNLLLLKLKVNSCLNISVLVLLSSFGIGLWIKRYYITQVTYQLIKVPNLSHFIAFLIFLH